MAGAYSVGRMTDEAGQFSFDGIYARDVLEIAVDASGFRSAQKTIGPGEGDGVDFVLDCGHSVTVEVVEQGGRAAPFYAVPLGGGGHSDRMGKGIVVWRQLPDVVTFGVQVSGCRFEVVHRAEESRARIEIPPLGSLKAQARGLSTRMLQHADHVRVELQLLDRAPAEPFQIVLDEAVDVLAGRYRARLIGGEIGESAAVVQDVDVLPGRLVEITFK